MRKYFTIFFLFLSVSAACGQRLATGEKAPSMKVKEWLSDTPADGKAQFIEFFHSSNKQCAMRLGELNSIANEYSGKLVVIVVSKEAPEKVSPILDPQNSSYYTAIDDGGRTFSNFGAQFVPFGVLTDRKGRVVWFGNPSSLDEKTIQQAL